MTSPSEQPSPGTPTTPETSPLVPSRAFTRADLSLVSAFSCCANPPNEAIWEKDVNDWIKAGPGQFGAIDAVENGIAHVWLYVSDDGDLIGYGSIATESILLSDGSSKTICLIPYVGIATVFQGLPTVPKEARFARRILWGLIEKVRNDGEFDDLFLWVDPNNPAFSRFYPLFGFVEFDRSSDSGDGREWVLMHKSLSR